MSNDNYAAVRAGMMISSATTKQTVILEKINGNLLVMIEKLNTLLNKGKWIGMTKYYSIVDVKKMVEIKDDFIDCLIQKVMNDYYNKRK